MYELQEKINTVLLQYYLLEYTKSSKNWGMVDFDDFRGVYNNGLEVCATDVTAYGEYCGILSRYEDELYHVNADKWQELYDSLLSGLSSFTRASIILNLYPNEV